MHVACSMCGGETTYLGRLGDRMHFRCRVCGMGVSKTKEDLGEELWLELLMLDCQEDG